MPRRNGSPRKLGIVWHPKVHEQWGKERRYIIRLAFTPTYRRREILAALNQVISRHHVLSYKLYEVTGETDIVLNLWLPTIYNLEDFRTAIWRSMEQYSPATCISLHVSRMLWHWLWSSKTTRKVVEPDISVLQHRPSDDILRGVNENTLRGQELQKLIRANLVAPFSVRPGIKFITTIAPLPSSPPHRDTEDLVVEKILDILVAAPRVYDLSFYKTDGHGCFLISGKVDPVHFDSINGSIIAPLNELNVLQSLRVRTFTSVVLNTHGDPVLFSDRIPLLGEVRSQAASVGSLLQDDESQNLEVKASLLMDCDRLFRGDGKSAQEKRIALEGALKTIVAFLNSSGGHLVIGALERKQFDIVPTLADDKRYPRYGQYIVVGLDLDYTKKGWDGFHLRLQDLLRDHIRPRVSGALLDIRKESIFGKDLCVISVREPYDSEWAYLLDDRWEKFYVRQGGRTIELAGPDGDQYKRIKATERRKKNSVPVESFTDGGME